MAEIKAIRDHDNIDRQLRIRDICRAINRQVSPPQSESNHVKHLGEAGMAKRANIAASALGVPIVRA